jgi:hypothetical protein
MIVKTKKIKSNQLDDNSINNKHLSIQFSLDGFSFCICHPISKEVLAYSKYIFDNRINTPQKLLKAIQKIFMVDDELQYSFDRVLALHDNNLITFVPNEFFNKDNLDLYLKYNNKLLSTDFYMYDTIKNQDMKSVYIPYVNVNNFLIDKFGSFEYRHVSSVLVESLLNDFASKNKQIFIDISETFFKIVVTENRKLILFNTFEHQTIEDFIYYVLFTAEQLNIDLTKEEIFCLGEVYNKKEFITNLKKYADNVNIIKPKKLILEHAQYETLAVEEFELFYT